MTICVIGGSGFIGTRFVRRMDQSMPGACVIVDKARSEAFPERTQIGDVRSVDDLRACVAEGSVIVNLAAEHRDDVRPARLYYDVNVEGAKNICRIAREKNVGRIVFTSTVAVYGFAEPGTPETGAIAPYNDYGRSKANAEAVLREWQLESPGERTLVIIRPTVVFGEQNRGNVYNLIKLVGSRRFVMIGDGTNRKSVAYVENVAAFIEFSLSLCAGCHVFNYVDKPDFSMNELVSLIKKTFGQEAKIRWRLGRGFGIAIASLFDVAAFLSGRRFAVSAIRVRKFCANSIYASRVQASEFKAPVPLEKALADTIRFDFLESHAAEGVFYSE